MRTSLPPGRTVPLQDMQMYYVDALPHAYLWIVPNGGHVPDLHAPFVPSLLPFLRWEWERR